MDAEAQVHPFEFRHLALACSAVASAVVVLTKDMVIRHANTAFCRMVGGPYEGIAGRGFLRMVEAENQQDLHQYLMQSLLFGEPEQEFPVKEFRLNSITGSQRYVEASLRIIQIGEQQYAVLTCQDLSDIQFVQSSLLNLGQVLHQIIENNPVATLVIDIEHKVTQWNTACAELTGTKAIDVIGKTNAWSAFFHDERPILADMIVDGTVMNRGKELYGKALRQSPLLANAWEVQGFFERFGRNGKWLLFNAAPLTDSDGRMIGAIETMQDITERIHAEQALIRHRTELEDLVRERTSEVFDLHHDMEAFLDNASVAIVGTSGRRIVRANRKFYEMFEVDEGQALGLPVRTLFSSSQAYAELLRTAIPALSQGNPVQQESEMISSRGTRLSVSLIAYVADRARPRAKIWWLIQDITEVKRVHAELEENFKRIRDANEQLKETQNQLLQSEKMAAIGQLAAGVAHEINNPIGFVSFNLSTLKRYAVGLLNFIDLVSNCNFDMLPAAQRETLKHCLAQLDPEYLREDLPQLLNESEEGLNRVKNIVKDLKDFSRVDQSDWQDADINAGLDSTLNVVMNEIKYKADIVKRYGDIPLVRCLAGQVNQVFLNIIVNAAYAISGFGEIRIETAMEGKFVLITIEDNGSGMPDEVKRRIFEPFFTTKPVGKGTGLGLSLSFSIIQKHGGSIQVHSEQGVGTRFDIRLPVDGPATMPSADPSLQ